MKQRVQAGGTLDILTPDEFVKLIHRPSQVSRVRAPEAVLLDVNGNGSIDVYKVPIGYEFAVRRVSLNLSTASDPSTGNVLLNVAGKYVAYQRSGTLIEYAVPSAPTGTPQVPGVQSWGEQQGPYLRNGEIFQVKAVGLTADAMLDVTVEGILHRPAVG